MVQPMLGSGDKNLSSYESSIQSNLHVKVNVMNNVLNEFAMSLNELDEKCYATADLRNVFDRIDEPLYYDLAHVSDFGNKIVADTTNSIKQIYEGKEDAKITIITYESLTCGHCADFHKNVYPQLKKEFIDTGIVKIVFKHFPLDIAALNASNVAQCNNY